MPSPGNRQPNDYVNGPGSGEKQMIAHGMKGIVGAMRAKTYKASDYSRGDGGGSAGGYGVPHGMHGDAGDGDSDEPMDNGYAGDSMGFEGGVRGGGVSEQETLPKPHRDKGGKPQGGGGGGGNPEHGAAGHYCGHGCGRSMKSPHGLARHVKAKHGGFGGLGKEVTHGTSYKKGQEFRGETEGPKEWAENENEWKRAESMATSDRASSYGSGDRGGSHGRVSSMNSR